MSVVNCEVFEWLIWIGMLVILFVNISCCGVGVVCILGNLERVSGYLYVNLFDFEGFNWLEVDCWLFVEVKVNCYCNLKECGDDWFIFRLLLWVCYLNLLVVDIVCVCFLLNLNWIIFWFYKKVVDIYCLVCLFDWFCVFNDMICYCGFVLLIWGWGFIEILLRFYWDCWGFIEVLLRLLRLGSFCGVDLICDVVWR